MENKMIDILDLIRNTFEIRIHPLEENWHILTFKVNDFESTCNISTEQLELLKQNCENISRAIRYYRPNSSAD